MNKNNPKCKIVGILICMLFIATAVLPVSGTICPNLSAEKQNINYNDEWWPMFRHDLKRSGHSPSTAPDTNTVLWSYNPPINSWFAESSPAVFNGKVYIGACAIIGLNFLAGRVYCLDEFDGSVLWTYSTDGQVLSSPAVADGNVYIGSFFDGKVHCIDGDEGSCIWTYQTGYQVFSSPAVANDRVYIGSYDYQQENGEILCLDAANGNLIWEYTPGKGVYSSPAISNDRVYVGSLDGRLYCLNAANGSLIWKYNTGSWVRSSPAVVNNNVYVGSGNGKVYCLDVSNGTEIWSYKTGDSVGSSPAISDGRLYIGSYDTKVYCLDASTGDHIWNYSTEQSVCASPAVADAKVYVGSGNIFSPAGKFNCLDALTGECLWYIPTDGVAYSSPAIARGKLYMSSSGGSLYCFSDNLPPYKPSRPSGPASGKPGVSYEYTTSTTDPNGDDVRYGWDWDGDKEVDEWTSFYPSGATVTMLHSWQQQGLYLVRVKAENTDVFQSEWSKPLVVIMPKNKLSTNMFFLRLSEKFPNVFPILRYLLGL